MMIELFDTILNFIGNKKDAFLVLITFLAALSSIYAAFTAAKTSRRNHITSLREKWIDELRNDISELMDIRSEILQNQSETRMDFIVAKIRLKLNTELRDHAELDEIIEKFRDSIGKGGNIKDTINITLELLNKSRIVLNKAWDKAVQGKP